MSHGIAVSYASVGLNDHKKKSRRLCSFLKPKRPKALLWYDNSRLARASCKKSIISILPNKKPFPPPKVRSTNQMSMINCRLYGRPQTSSEQQYFQPQHHHCNNHSLHHERFHQRFRLICRIFTRQKNRYYDNDHQDEWEGCTRYIPAGRSLQSWGSPQATLAGRTTALPELPPVTHFNQIFLFDNSFKHVLFIAKPAAFISKFCEENLIWLNKHLPPEMF